MTNFLKEVEEKIKKELGVEKVLVIDNSYLHKKHQSFGSGQFHLKLIIKSAKLKNMNKVQSNRLIFSILKKELKNKIHALQIKIT